MFVLYKIWLFSKCLLISFLEKQCFSIHYFEFFYYFQELSLVSGDDLCLGPNTVSLSVCQSDCIGELIKINSQKAGTTNNQKQDSAWKYMLLKNCRYSDYENHWQTICEKLYQVLRHMWLLKLFSFLFLIILTCEQIFWYMYPLFYCIFFIFYISLFLFSFTAIFFYLYIFFCKKTRFHTTRIIYFL